MTYEFLNDLNDTQKLVCKSNDNFILTACPGSGKTRTITYRIAYLSHKYCDSKKLNIAITYTNRAAEEIENRLIDMDVDTQNIWTGTIHQFCMKFIIRPYSMYHKKLSKGYVIIDEYIKENYVKKIAENIGETGYISNLYKKRNVMDIYYQIISKKKEIDFEQILQYSLELVEKNDFISQNISGMIRSIHIDEYQDTNEIQYRILSSIIKADNKINILFVGDVNQAIYRNLGGSAKTAEEIRQLFPINFLECRLDGCYRSSQRIIDYYINFEIESTGVYSTSDIKENNGVISYDVTTHKEILTSRIAKIIEDQLLNGIREEEICIVAPQWYQIYPMSNNLRRILPECNFDAPDITPIKSDPTNIYFIIAKLLFTQTSGKPYIRRKLANEIISIIHEDYEIDIVSDLCKLDILKAINLTTFIEDDGIKTLRNAIENVFKLMGIEKNEQLDKIYNQFFNKIEERISLYKLDFSCNAMIKSFNEKNGIVVSTIHGIKGEEYTTVIAFDLLNGHLPHWDYILNWDMKRNRNEETKKLLYVLCSRAKENLYLFSEKGRTTQGGNDYTPTDELKKCSFEYD